METISWKTGNGELGLPLRPLPELKKQRRKRQAKNSSPEWKICGADTETVHGKIWLFSTEEGVWEITTLYDLMKVLFNKDHARRWRKSKTSKGGNRSGISPREFYFWNLKFDAQAVMKLFSDSIISSLIDDDHSEKIIVNAKTGKTTPFIDGEMVELEYLEGKMFKLKPLNWYIGQYKLGECYWWDISQFYYRIKLNTAAKLYLNKEKLEHCFDGSVLDVSRLNEVEYREKYITDIKTYAVIDAQLAGELTRRIRTNFLSQSIRFIMPYSMANVAQRALLDTSIIPTINSGLKDQTEQLRMRKALTAYNGGWFETAGSGYVENVKGYDLASAYPATMRELDDHTKGVWVEGDSEAEWWEWMEVRNPFQIGFAECAVLFKEGLPWNPLVQKSSTKTLVSPRYVEGWFSAEEIEEARKWPIDSMIIGEWFYHAPSEEVKPYRSFIDKFYKIKMESANDEAAYSVSKVALNSIYGKTIQAVNNKIGKLWNPYHAAMITGSTRARMAEFNRVNGFKALSFATDGIVMPKGPITIPPRKVDAPYNLGEWEHDKSGELLILMSGVYSIAGSEKVKTTFRGSASYFLRGYKDGGLFRFCDENSSRSELTAYINKPWSAKQARIKKDYSLINVFEENKFTITALGDSNKRRWGLHYPELFGDLTEEWWPSSPHSEVDISAPYGM